MKGDKKVENVEGVLPKEDVLGIYGVFLKGALQVENLLGTVGVVEVKGWWRAYCCRDREIGGEYARGGNVGCGGGYTMKSLE